MQQPWVEYKQPCVDGLVDAQTAGHIWLGGIQTLIRIHMYMSVLQQDHTTYVILCSDVCSCSRMKHLDAYVAR